MAPTPETRPSLLVRLRDPGDRDAWEQFVDLYGPLVYRFGRRRGLQDADAADLTQTVLQAVSGGVGRLDYDPARGTFRGWLFAVVRNHLGKFYERQRRTPQGGPTELLDEQPARAAGDEELWEREYHRQLFVWAAGRVRGDFEEASWRAFWRTAVEGIAAAEAARALGMTVGAVYTAKSRVLDRIRKEVQQARAEE